MRIHRCRGRMALVAIASVVAATPAAIRAQSRVTLYGVADANIEYVSNFSSTVPTAANGFTVGAANNLVRMSSGGLAGSRLAYVGPRTWAEVCKPISSLRTASLSTTASLLLADACSVVMPGLA
jgi:hypothetical protein